MEKIFYRKVSDFSSSADAVKNLLTERFNIPSPVIKKTENGKPYLQNPCIGLHFSVAHTGNALFIAFSDENVGIDTENIYRESNYPPIVRKFSVEEREEIYSKEDFLKHWTVKEAAVKWLGGSLSQDLKKLVYAKEKLYYEGLELPVRITVKHFDEYLVTVCGERDFSNVEIL